MFDENNFVNDFYRDYCTNNYNKDQFLRSTDLEKDYLYELMYPYPYETKHRKRFFIGVGKKLEILNHAKGIIEPNNKDDFYLYKMDIIQEILQSNEEVRYRTYSLNRYLYKLYDRRNGKCLYTGIGEDLVVLERAIGKTPFSDTKDILRYQRDLTQEIMNGNPEFDFRIFTPQEEHDCYWLWK